MEVKINKTFIIRHKKTQEIWSHSSGRSSWKQASHAKSSWQSSRSDTKRLAGLVDGRYGKTPPYFDQQDVYEIIELQSEDSLKLEESIALLARCYNYFPMFGTTPLGKEVARFIEDSNK